MIVNMKTMLEKAKEERYGVGAFDCTSLESAMAIVGAAEELNAPVVLQYAESHRKLISLDIIGPIMVQLAKAAIVPVCVHLDHGTSFDICKKAIALGFTSVMYDASAKDYEVNIGETKEVTEYAHAKRVTVEAELGHIFTSKAGSLEGIGQEYTEKDAYTDPKMARNFIEETKVDALAIGFGTAHGIYVEKPKLDLNRISLIKKEIDACFVMHGGSGLSEQEYKTAIHNGIQKINYYTYLSLAGGSAVANYIKENNSDHIYFEDLAKCGTEAMKEDLKKAITVFGSVDKS